MSQSQHNHNLGIDVLKAILVAGMVYDHALNLLSDNPTHLFMAGFKNILGLVTFSGFVFSFGYATWHAYFSKPPTLNRILPSVIRPWIAYYISAFVYVFLVERLRGSANLFDVLFLVRLVPYAEFLLAFSLILLFGYIFHKPINHILERPRLFLATIGVLLLTTFIPNGWVGSPFLSLFIGSPKAVASSFPVLQYFPLYLAGMYFARYNLKPNVWVGLAGIAGYFVYINVGGVMTRFPPNLAWILASFFFVIIWYFVADFLSRWKPVNRLLVPVGINALFFLVISNMMIFAFRSAMPKQGDAMNLIATTGITLFILAVAYFLVNSVRRIDLDPPAVTTPSESA